MSNDITKEDATLLMSLMDAALKGEKIHLMGRLSEHALYNKLNRITTGSEQGCSRPSLPQDVEVDGKKSKLVGWTNEMQVSHMGNPDGGGSVYPDQEEGCNTPVFIPGNDWAIIESDILEWLVTPWKAKSSQGSMLTASKEPDQ